MAHINVYKPASRISAVGLVTGLRAREPKSRGFFPAVARDLPVIGIVQAGATIDPI